HVSRITFHVSRITFHVHASRSPHDQPNTPGHQHRPSHPANGPNLWRHLFHQHEYCDEAHPPHVHDARDEQQGHQQPATTSAIEPVPQAHTKGAPRALP